MAVRIWEIRSPDGGSTGLEFARARMGVSDRVLVHSAPSRLDVEVYSESGEFIARGSGLEGSEPTPMARLTIDPSGVSREQIWPGTADLGLPVILPGGEVGVLTAWWNADDHSAWRWSIELSNHR
ncbi:MAG: hypothetical protein WEB06_02780 [Actinomycetota bacterium]